MRELTASAARIRAIADAIYASRPDLQKEFQTARDPEFMYWLMWDGIVEHPEIRPALYPQPPQNLRERVAGHGISDEGFHQGGAVDWHRLYSCLVEGGYDFSRPGRVLDFGCGPGRTLRFFSDLSDVTTFVGCDVDLEALAWCRAHIDFAEFVAVPPTPPLPFADGSFQAIMAFSVFTHLPEPLHLAYLAELRRIAAPGAVVVLSTHGADALRLFAEGTRPMMLPTPATAAAQIPHFEAGRFVFMPYEDIRLFGEDYGTVFIPRAYIEREWARYFKIAAFFPAPDEWQDYCVLIRTVDD